MADAKPVALLLVLSGCVLAWLVLHYWIGTSAATRTQRLLAIARVEQAETGPPSRLADQTWWLLAHRRERLLSLSLLWALGSLIGIGEGLWWRQRDPQRGVRLRNWTLGVLMGAGLTGGLLGALVLWPTPWTVPVVASSGTLWGMTTLFLLASGRPYVA